MSEEQKNVEEEAKNENDFDTVRIGFEKILFGNCTEYLLTRETGAVPVRWMEFQLIGRSVTLAIRISSPLFESGIEVPIMYPLPANRGPSLVWSEKNPDFKFCDFPIWMKLKSGQSQSVHQVVSNNFLTHLVSPDQLWRLDHDHLS
uniref:Uncharacterized protein n=1 Tax=Onchocerca volvulus TaxID=6282 RepID=A0A8R1TPU1_ONCVO